MVLTHWATGQFSTSLQPISAQAAKSQGLDYSFRLHGWISSCIHGCRYKPCAQTLVSRNFRAIQWWFFFHRFLSIILWFYVVCTIKSPNYLQFHIGKHKSPIVASAALNRIVNPSSSLLQGFSGMLLLLPNHVSNPFLCIVVNWDTLLMPAWVSAFKLVYTLFHTGSVSHMISILCPSLSDTQTSLQGLRRGGTWGASVE